MVAGKSAWLPSHVAVRIEMPKRPVYEPRTVELGTIHTIPAMRILLLLGVLTLPLHAADDTPPPARKVTITGEAKTPAEIAKEIKAQTGSDVDVSPLDPKPVAADFQKLDYWT